MTLETCLESANTVIRFQKGFECLQRVVQNDGDIFTKQRGNLGQPRRTLVSLRLQG